MSDCLFCKIVSGEIPSYKIYEDESYLAFLDINPLLEAHTLVIPKKHYRWVWDVENIGEYMKVCQKIAKHFQKVSGKDYIFSMIHGEVPHAHIHLIPAEKEALSNGLKKFIDHFEKINFDNKKAKKIINKYKVN